ncbi:MAG: hypothetical protein ACOYON_06395, partial [Fimbriimonas sp.]
PASPTTLSVGITDVFVNGTPVMRNSRPTGPRPGQILTRLGTKFMPTTKSADPGFLAKMAHDDCQ